MLEFDLHQGWTKGLRIVFENAPKSQNINLKTALHVEQVHGDEIHFLKESDLKAPSPLSIADGIFVQGDFFKQSKRPVLIKTADCIPLFLIDRESQAFAALHVGWRGLAKGLHTKLFKQGHLNPKTTWAWVGPSLSGPQFEVKEDMWSQFKKSEEVKYFSRTPSANTRHFHAWSLLEDELNEFGIDMVYNVEENTYSNEEYFSHRRSSQLGVKREGNNFSWCQFF